MSPLGGTFSGARDSITPGPPARVCGKIAMTSKGERLPRQRVTIYDVAEAAGVSASTASRALSGRRTVKAATRRAVLAAARRLGYRANTIAQSLRIESTRTVGMVIPQISNPFFPLLVEAVERALLATRRELLLCDSQSSSELELARVDALVARQVDGLILVPCDARQDNAALASAQAYVPLVLLDRSVEGAACDYVGVDHAAGVRMAVEHVASLGCRRLAFASAAPTGSAGKLRLQAYLDAACEVDVSAPDRVELDDFSAEAGQRAAARLLERPDPPDAIICGADVIALGVLSVIQARGLSVPGDVAVTGFDDIPYAEFSSPALTTVRQPTDALGRECVRLLEERIADPNKPHTSSIFTPTLVARRSTLGDAAAS
jgi:LacI family transcriptional regulator